VKKKLRENGSGLNEKSVDDDTDDEKAKNEYLRPLQGRVQRASERQYLDIIEDASALHSHENRQETGTWKLRKRVYMSSDSELD